MLTYHLKKLKIGAFEWVSRYCAPYKCSVIKMLCYYHEVKVEGFFQHAAFMISVMGTPWKWAQEVVMLRVWWVWTAPKGGERIQCCWCWSWDYTMHHPLWLIWESPRRYHHLLMLTLEQCCSRDLSETFPRPQYLLNFWNCQVHKNSNYRGYRV